MYCSLHVHISSFLSLGVLLKVRPAPLASFTEYKTDEKKVPQRDYRMPTLRSNSLISVYIILLNYKRLRNTFWLFITINYSPCIEIDFDFAQFFMFSNE